MGVFEGVKAEVVVMVAAIEMVAVIVALVEVDIVIKDGVGCDERVTEVEPEVEGDERSVKVEDMVGEIVGV